MKYWNVILATIVIFGAGVVTGGLLVHHTEHPLPHSHAMEPGPKPPEQREQIQKVISQGQQNTRNLWKLVGPQFQLIWRDTRGQIRQVLTPEQKKKFETLMKEQHHPQSTNAPSAQLPASTNAPAAPALAPTNAPAI